MRSKPAAERPPDETFGRTARAFETLVEGITPWLIDLGGWIFGALIALNLLVLASLVTVGPSDPAVLIATLCLALIDPASGELEIVNCGHMPPLLVHGQNATYVGEGGLLLGVPMHEPHQERMFLPPEGTLLLMTDGLVEERDVFLDVNLEKLRVAAQEVGGADAEAFINHLMAIFGAREDDVAMIALRRTGT